MLIIFVFEFYENENGSYAKNIQWCVLYATTKIVMMLFMLMMTLLLYKSLILLYHDYFC